MTPRTFSGKPPSPMTITTNSFRINKTQTRVYNMQGWVSLHSRQSMPRRKSSLKKLATRKPKRKLKKERYWFSPRLNQATLNAIAKKPSVLKCTASAFQTAKFVSHAIAMTVRMLLLISRKESKPLKKPSSEISRHSIHFFFLNSNQRLQLFKAIQTI